MKSCLILMSLILPFSFVNAGGETSGGANRVNGVLIEDYLNQKTKPIPKDKLIKAANKYLIPLETKLPGFARKLRDSISKTQWISDEKALSGEDGNCIDKTMSGVDLSQEKFEIVACQNKYKVRMAIQIVEAPDFAEYVIHELLMFQKIHGNENGLITDASIMEVSPLLRGELKNTSAETLKENLIRFDFGEYLTTQEAKQIKAVSAELSNDINTLISAIGASNESDILKNISSKHSNKLSAWTDTFVVTSDNLRPLVRELRGLLYDIYMTELSMNISNTSESDRKRSLESLQHLLKKTTVGMGELLRYK